MPAMWGARRNSSTPSVWMHGAGKIRVKRDNNTLKVLAVKWAIENGLLPDETKWYAVNWERGKVIENDRKKLYWG